jgi:hypothetical protein
MIENVAPQSRLFAAERSLLYNVSPFDPFTFIAVSTFLVSVAFLASFIPAARDAGGSTGRAERRVAASCQRAGRGSLGGARRGPGPSRSETSQ